MSAAWQEEMWNEFAGKSFVVCVRGLVSGLSWRAENLNLPLDAGRTLCYNIIRRGDIAKW